MLTADERNELVELLKLLVRIKSANPPGNEEEIAVFIKDYLSREGIKADLIPLEERRSSVIGCISGREKGSVVLCGHIDTVDTEEEKWRKPPFEAIVESGKVYGLGTSDMKAGIAVILQAAKTVASRSTSLRKNLILALTADEEGAYRGAHSLVESDLLNDAEVLIVMEPTDGYVFIGEKGELWIEAAFSGKAAHGSTPELGINAILPACEFCSELAVQVRQFEKAEGLGKTTLNIGQFEGGCRVNVVPDTARVKLDFRVITDKDKIKVLDLINCVGDKIAIRYKTRFTSYTLNYQPPIISDVNNPYIKRFSRVVTDTTGKIANEQIVPYCTDAATIISKLNVPVVIYGPGSIAQAHQPNEYVTLSSLYESLEVMVRFLKEC